MRLNFKFLAIILVLIVLVAFAVPVLAAPVYQDNPSPEVPGLVQVLEMLANGIGLGFVLAFLFEKPGWFKDMPDNTKWWVILGLSVGLPPLAQALLEFVPPNIWARIEPYWLAIAKGFMIWAGSQVAFKMFVKPNQNKPV